jgi:hypothetical protein
MFRLKPCTLRTRYDVNEIQSKRLERQKDAMIDTLAGYLSRQKTRDETRQDLIAIRMAVLQGCR